MGKSCCNKSSAGTKGKKKSQIKIRNHINDLLTNGKCSGSNKIITNEGCVGLTIGKNKNGIRSAFFAENVICNNDTIVATFQIIDCKDKCIASEKEEIKKFTAAGNYCYEASKHQTLFTAPGNVDNLANFLNTTNKKTKTDNCRIVYDSKKKELRVKLNRDDGCIIRKGTEATVSYGKHLGQKSKMNVAVEANLKTIICAKCNKQIRQYCWKKHLYLLPCNMKQETEDSRLQQLQLNKLKQPHVSF